jgi:hypothetical protein
LYIITSGINEVHFYICLQEDDKKKEKGDKDKDKQKEATENNNNEQTNGSIKLKESDLLMVDVKINNKEKGTQLSWS